VSHTDRDTLSVTVGTIWESNSNWSFAALTFPNGQAGATDYEMWQTTVGFVGLILSFVPLGKVLILISSALGSFITDISCW